MPQRTPDGKWVLWETSTGRRYEAWPVDAHGMLASGYATDVQPTGTEAGPAPEAPALTAPPLPPVQPEGTSTAADTMGEVKPTTIPIGRKRRAASTKE